MSIGKPKNEPIDLNGLMNEIDNDHRITVESDAVDKRIEELDRKSTRLNSSHRLESRMPSSA